MGNRVIKPLVKKHKRLLIKADDAYNRSQFDRCLTLAQERLQLLQSEKKSDAIAIAHTITLIGKVYWRKGNLEDSLRCFTQAFNLLQQNKKVPTADSPLLLAVRSSIGCIHAERGEHAKSLTYLQDVMNTRERVVPGSADLAMTYHNVGVVLCAMGRKDESYQHHMRALRIKEKVAPGSETLANSYNGVGSAYLIDFKDPANALAYFSKAQAIAKKLKRPSLDVLVLAHLGDYMYRTEGDRAKALELFREALDKESSIAKGSLIAATLDERLVSVLKEVGKLSDTDTESTRSSQDSIDSIDSSLFSSLLEGGQSNEIEFAA